MYALVTGASSGIGRDISIELSKKGYDIILVGRNEDKLKETASLLKTEYKIIPVDLAKSENCLELYNKVKDLDIDILVNNAGFGIFGKFDEIDIDKQINMINVNITALDILSKLFLQDMKKKNRGFILNVASSAAFIPGPLLSTYYGSKAYVLRITEAIYEELRRDNYNGISISVLCPGPVNTNFNDVAGVRFAIKGLSSEYVAMYAVKNMFKQKLVIIPGTKIRLGCFVSRFVPRKLLLKITYNFQKKKGH